MNKFEKKSKNKSFKKSLNKVKKNAQKTKGKKKGSNEDIGGDNEDIDGDIEESDEILKNELQEIITDFKKNDSKKSSKKSKLKNAKDFKNIEKNSKSADFSFEKPRNEFENKVKPNFNNNNKELLIKTQIKWYEMRVFDESKETVNRISNQRVNELRSEAVQLLKNDIELYQHLQQSRDNREDFNWIKTVLRRGTLADKLAANTLLIQDSPIHNLKSLETVIQMVNTKGKRECVMALDNLRELFIGDLLVPNSKLRSFSELINNGFNDKSSDKNSRNVQLVLCYFEEQLKNNYQLFLESVVKVSHDSVDNTKNKALITFFDLLVNNGEQEQYLLQSLVNKLGDPLPKVAAQSSHLLNQLINQYHPLMKSVVVEEVERLLYRPNINTKAQYYGLCFLSEVIFSADDKLLANKLIGIYFGFFKGCVKKGDINDKMMSVLLTGVTRAFPYSKLETNILEEHLQTFYKLIHFVNFNTSIQALMLIFNIIDVNDSGLLTDRFYTVLYRHILESRMDSCSRKAIFLNLIFKALKKDPIVKRVKAFIKRLLQMALTLSSSLAASILVLVSEVIKSRPVLMIAKQSDTTVNYDDDDEEEKYEDVPLSDDECNDDKSAVKTGSASWVHNKNSDTNRSRSTHYDINCRNPLYANAESVDLWELLLLKTHFHPSTNLFSQKIVNSEFVDYDGDPLNDFSVKNFLDRFVFRNPKKINKKNSNARGSNVFGRIQTNEISMPVLNSDEYLNQPESKIPIDQQFIYKYLKQRMSSKTDESDVESVTSVEFEKLLDHFEPGNKRERKIDFANDFYEKNKPIDDKDNEEDIGSDDELDDDMDDDDELGFDPDNDEEFADAFDGVDSELEDALDVTEKKGPKKLKRGFDNISNDLFASADEFAQLLEQNQSDSDLSGDEEDEEEKRKSSKRSPNGKKKSNKPFLGRKKKRKTFDKDLL